VLGFPPHRYARTRDLLDDVARVLAEADVVMVLHVYAAGEAVIAGADGRALCRAIRSRGQIDPVFVEQGAELAGLLQGILKHDDVVLTVGAGDIGAMSAGLQQTLQEGVS